MWLKYLVLSIMDVGSFFVVIVIRYKPLPLNRSRIFGFQSK
jgi:hypothetical protein